MSDLESLREGVRQSLPELAEIQDTALREKVVEAWALALSETEYRKIEDIPGAAVPGAPPIKNGTQVEHLRGTAVLALGIADAMEKVFGPIGIDRNTLVAGALAHDLGKPYEFSPRNRARWEARPADTGKPAIRHPAYGVHIALMAGLPEPVAHIVGAHSMHCEGQFVTPSLEALIVRYADSMQWRILDKVDLLAGKRYPDV